MVRLVHEFKSVILVLHSNFVREPIGGNFFIQFFVGEKSESWVQVSGTDGPKVQKDLTDENA